MSGRNPVPQTQAYEGVRAETPPNHLRGKVDPTTSTVRNVRIGDLYTNTVTGNTWELGQVAGGLAAWYLVSGPGGSLSLQTVTTTSQSMQAGREYVSSNALLSTFTLPVSASVGDNYRIIGTGAAFWTIAQNAGQVIHFNAVSTTPGVGGSITSTQAYNVIDLVCTVANTDFVVTNISGAQAAYTVV